MFSQATLLMALAASASAHMTMNWPVPYSKSSLNSSPLAPGDFPCKQRPGMYEVTEMNQWNAGETKTISFTGSAVHGGGSCQFSITTDPEPSEKSQWKVIQSVVGGCPSNVTGNIEPADPNGHGAATFPVEMPSTIPDGQYTFAWTWINKIGNREFYMNCAPIKVGSSASKRSTVTASAALAALPDMFVANLPDTSCSTAEGEDFNYPNPGKNLIEGNGAHLGDTLTGSGCAQMTKMGAGSGEIGTPTEPEASQPAGSETPAASSPLASLPANNGGIFAPGASPAPTPTATPIVSKPISAPQQPADSTPQQPADSTPQPPAQSAPQAPTESAPQPPALSPAPETPENGTNTPSGNGDCTPCDNDGAVVCIGTSQFGLCNHGCVVAQPLANGMSCTGGAVVASVKKRSLHFPRAHLHRRHGASHLI